jgi:hypothetical protein
MRKLSPEEEQARETIAQVISDYRTVLEAITLLKADDCPSPILIEGETRAGYYCQMMVDPREVAPILLRYNHPVWLALGEDSPDAMWEELGEHFGLASVSSVDL